MIKVRKEGEEIIVNLFQLSKINTLFTDYLESELNDLVCLPGQIVYFDLSSVNFIDSAGFSMLIRISARAKENSSKFILCNITDDVQELINLLEMQNSFEILEKNLKKESLLLEVE